MRVPVVQVSLIDFIRSSSSDAVQGCSFLWLLDGLLSNIFYRYISGLYYKYLFSLFVCISF